MTDNATGKNWMSKILSLEKFLSDAREVWVYFAREVWVYSIRKISLKNPTLARFAPSNFVADILPYLYDTDSWYLQAKVLLVLDYSTAY